MPKPLLLRRPSGLYARFRLPSEVFRRLDVRFLVRSLGHVRGDAARLMAARMGYALARAIETTGERVDKKLLDAALAAAQRGEVVPYKITLPSGHIRTSARRRRCRPTRRAASPARRVNRAPATSVAIGWRRRTRAAAHGAVTTTPSTPARPTRRPAAPTRHRRPLPPVRPASPAARGRRRPTRIAAGRSPVARRRRAPTRHRRPRRPARAAATRPAAAGPRRRTRAARGPTAADRAPRRRA